MSTYADGKRIHYPKPGDWVCHEAQQGDPERERGLVTNTDETGQVWVSWDEGDDTTYEADVLYLHQSGWYWVEPGPEEVGGWG